ncbi:hypothetical protein CIL05_14970 [Virgibacillus profundi]|uniref:Uncharacterized protein n=1 Tax=Virgibacillus profundi TaxID=2024555 RepID=A0A2A2IAD4_9BACI|nr:hypothetical protein [Virgibacillus profundi]PAV28597.1 hypothetical protein CIL05_14970 [Virgibacillus profundi]PXY52765.1 hypothetical protein CIT14_15095 [Virgibacillus profundi]
MKQVLLSFFVVGFVLLAGCSNSNEIVFSSEASFSVEERYYSDEKDHYSLLILGDENVGKIDWFDWQEENNIRNVNTFNFAKLTPEEAKKRFKFLELEELPAYLAFDNNNIVLQTNNEEELIKFLQDKVPESWNY